MPPEALQKLKEKLNAIDNAVTIEELKKAIEAMMQFSVKLQTKTETELVAIKTAVDGAISRIQELSKTEADEAKQEIMDSCDSMMNEMRLTHEAMMAEATTKIDSLVQPKDGESGEDGKDGKDGKDGSPDTSEQVRDKLESIEGEDNKLEINAIGHLEEELKKLRKQISDISTRPIIGGVASRDIVRSMDISDQLDGVKKTFQTSAMYRVIAVLMSSTPAAAPRENIDFTWSDTSLTFTAQVDASTSLAAGQSVIILYTSL